MVYFANMIKAQKTTVNLTELRENAGLGVRELARQLNIHHTTILQWERASKVTKTEFLVPMAAILGVTVEELLGQERPKRYGGPGGKLGQVIKRVSELPRRQQDRVIDIFETVLAGQQTKAKASS